MSVDQIFSYIYSILVQWGFMNFINAALIIILIFTVIGVVQWFRNKG